MKSLLKRYKIEFEPEEEEVKPATANSSCEDRLVEALLQATNKKPAALEHVNISAELGKLGLDAFFPIASWPPMNAVRKLATKMRRLLKAGLRSLSLQLNCESELLCDRCCLRHLLCVIELTGSCHLAVASTSIS